LDEFTKVTECHRKAVIRLLHQVNKVSTLKKRGRLMQYSVAVVRVLRLVWEVTDRLCSKQLKPFSP